jgi:hypothetical protein
MKDLSSEYLLEIYRTNVSIFFSLSSEAFASVQKLARLNLQAGHTMLAEGMAFLRETMPDPAASEGVAANTAASTASSAARAARKSVQSVLEAAQANASRAAAGAPGDVAAEPGEPD